MSALGLHSERIAIDGDGRPQRSDDDGWGSGHPDDLLIEDGGRRLLLADESAAKFTAILDFDEPHLIEAEAYGPLASHKPQSAYCPSNGLSRGRGVSGGDSGVPREFTP